MRSFGDPLLEILFFLFLCGLLWSMGKKGKIALLTVPIGLIIGMSSEDTAGRLIGTFITVLGPIVSLFIVSALDRKENSPQPNSPQPATTSPQPSGVIGIREAYSVKEQEKRKASNRLYREAAHPTNAGQDRRNTKIAAQKNYYATTSHTPSKTTDKPVNNQAQATATDTFVLHENVQKELDASKRKGRGFIEFLDISYRQQGALKTLYERSPLASMTVPPLSKEEFFIKQCEMLPGDVAVYHENFEWACKQVSKIIASSFNTSINTANNYLQLPNLQAPIDIGKNMSRIEPKLAGVLFAMKAIEQGIDDILDQLRQADRIDQPTFDRLLVLERINQRLHGLGILFDTPIIKDYKLRLKLLNVN